jgi:(1->4)-alpha-D-glucan 1-alpha-D-glucosylmutase
VVGCVVFEIMTSRSRPLATYRLQFNREFTFRQAAAIVPYLASLGISHCYASPYLRARPGSMHGYDIIDHNSLNPEIGSAEDYEYFVSELHRHGMGQILDIVPNHMGVMGSDNAWWLDALENGEASAYADFFEIDWYPLKDELRGKVLVPVLEDQYGLVLERGELKLVGDSEHGTFSIFYHEHRFPIDPSEYPRILGSRPEILQARVAEAAEDFLELQSILTAFQHLPDRRQFEPDKKTERDREKEVQKRRLAALCLRSSPVSEILAENVRLLNGELGRPKSFDALHQLIKAQAYRLTQWRVADDDINYRRFFDVNELAALRMENDAVFNATHSFVFKLVAEGKVDGLRIDHPDGLYDPAQYLRKLQTALEGAESPDELRVVSVPLVVEKILTGDEQLRSDWPVAGTTGYEFSNLVNGLFVDAAAESRMDRAYRIFTGNRREFRNSVYLCKKLILKASLASELTVLATTLSRIALSDRYTCDFTLNGLQNALAEIIACFPVYRTYVTGDRVVEEDRLFIEQAVGAARKRSHVVERSVFDFVRQILLLEPEKKAPGPYGQAVIRFAMKFQQVTSAVMAKGMEDTALYRYHRLISLNDVGGDPSQFGVTVEEFHRANQVRRHEWPASMLATCTHDSKRSEDVRARINVLSEVPAAWRLQLRRWRDGNRAHKQIVDSLAAPSRGDEYLLYQTLMGAWPVEATDAEGWKQFCDRIEQYMLKAAREAKQHTSWASHNDRYESALTHFVQSLLLLPEKNDFVSDFSQFHRLISRMGMFNSLSQVLLKLTSPGVPDTYQGNELWDFSLVDPDNRRPIDYHLRQRLFDDLQKAEDATGTEKRAAYLSEMLDSLHDGRIKMFLIWKTLRFRQQFTSLFQQGDYVPLSVSGGKAGHICAFSRRLNSQVAMVISPRLCATLLGGQHDTPVGEQVWQDTQIAIPTEIRRQAYRNAFTGESLVLEKPEDGFISVSALLKNFPEGLFVAE